MRLPLLPLIVCLLILGCVSANNKATYEAPLHTMKVLEQQSTPASSWQVEEVPDQVLADQQPGTRPALDSDEAGIWMAMDKAETEYRTAGNLIQAPELTAYLQGMTNRLAPEYSRDIRIYVLRVPYFNAAMAPNGALMIWSGLLLRAANEAQVAAVIGHEIGHYLRRHSLQRLRGVINTSGVMTVVQLATAAAGVGVTGNMASLLAMSGLQAYGRDQEREADGYGLALMARAGYDPHQAARLWERVIREMEASRDKKFSSLLFDSHPPSRERLAALDTLAERIVAHRGGGETKNEPYRSRLLPYRFAFLEDELHQRDFGRLEVLLTQLREDDPHAGDLSYFQGELYRMRGEEGDMERAVAAAERARGESSCPAEAFRTLGLIYQRLGRGAESKSAFATYLERKPEAMDREMITHMMAKEEK